MLTLCFQVSFTDSMFLPVISFVFSLPPFPRMPVTRGLSVCGAVFAALYVCTLTARARCVCSSDLHTDVYVGIPAQYFLTAFKTRHSTGGAINSNRKVSVSVFSSGALKKNLTGEQIKEDLLTLGTHPSPLCLRVILTVVVLVTVTFVLMKANLLTLIISQD